MAVLELKYMIFFYKIIVYSFTDNLKNNIHQIDNLLTTQPPKHRTCFTIIYLLCCLSHLFQIIRLSLESFLL